jgi:cyanophycinase
MNLRLVIILFAAFLAAQVPAQNSRFIGPERGSLVIVGGGRVTPEIWARFIELAGGAENAKVVVVPTAGESVPDDGRVPRSDTPAVLQKLGVPRVTVLHTSNRHIADSEAFVAPLRTATAVWFDGGRQWHIADSYLGTRAQYEFEAVLLRGGVIGGSSAGASIMGDFLWRGDTSGPDKVEGDHRLGFAYLKKTAIDQHILVRNRQFDLVPFIERHRDFLGIGINESTAIVVRGNEFNVIGASYVAITDAQKWDAKSKSPNDAARNGRIYFLSPGQRYDLLRREIIAGE